MTEPILPLASDFPPAREEEWRRLVERALRGRGLESLVSRTDDDIAVEPLYTPADAAGEEGLPGSFPALRGARAAGNLPAGWEVRQLHRHPDPEVAAAEIAEDLARGVHSVWLRLDRRFTRGGETPDGTVLLDAADLAPILAACRQAGAGLALDPGGDVGRVAALLRERTASGPTIELGADPLGAALCGEHPTPEEALAATAEIVPSLAQQPGIGRLLCASGLPWHDAGASEAQELAATLATAIAYLRLLTEAGLAPEQAAGRIGLRLAADPDIFATSAKLRVARRLWAQVMRHCGIGDVAPHLHAVTAPRVMTRRDPWTNMLRVTAAVLAAALGGADAVTALPFDHAIGLPDRFARRIARNTQLVLLLESRLHHPIDPLGGSWFAGRFADELAHRAWDLLRAIEAEGGMARALHRGRIQEEVLAVRERRLHDLARGRVLLVGVSRFADLEEAPRQAPAPDLARLRARRDAAPIAVPSGERPKIRTLAPMRLAEPFERLRDRSDAFFDCTGRRPTVLLLRLGRPAACIGPATLARNLFEAGGLAVAEAPADGPEAAAYDPTAHPLVTLCVGEEALAERASALARRLRDESALRVHLAGEGPADAFDAVLGEEIDALALLEDAWRAIEEAAR